MANKLVRVRVLGRETRPGNGDSYDEIELLDVVDIDQHQFKLTRFRRANENKIVVGSWFEGTQKPSKNPAYNDIFSDVRYIEGPDAIATPFEDWPEPAKEERDSRQKSILVQSDIRAAASMAKTWDSFVELYARIKAFREAEEAK